MPRARIEDLSPQDRDRFTKAVADFEAAWQQSLREGGRPPRILDHLPAEEPLRSALAAELALIDLERRLEARQGVRVEQYLKLLPLLSKDRAAVLSLIQAEYEFRRPHEPALQAAEYARRFPALAPQLQERLAADAAGGKVTGRPRPARETVTDPRGTTPHQPAPGSSAGAETPGRWYYAKDNQKQIGPLSWDELRQAAAQGQLTGSDMVHQEGTSKWQPAGSVPGLFPAAPAAPDGPGAARTGPFPEVPGYEILGELGRGGMGVVYRAVQVKLKRPVALKMILAGAHAGPTELARFRVEAEAVARLQHPNIVQIHEVGEQNGLPYFSLEYVDGGSLEKKLQRLPQPPREAAALVETLARAIEAAHRQKIVHRDLKPANVLLTNDGTPKITDFGLAKRLEGGTVQTHSGAVVGTPCYMAPEQALGQVQQIGPATDVYALGAILYEMLTGRPPFLADTPLNTVYQVATEEPVPPSRLQPGVPRDLETICVKCLEKEPKKRYASAEELAARLRMFLEGRPIPDRPVGVVDRAWRWAKRRPAAAAAYTLLLVAAVLGSVGGVATWLWQQSESGRRQEEALRGQAEKAQKEAERAKGDVTQARDQLADALGMLKEETKRKEEANAREAVARDELLRVNQIVRYTRNLELAHRAWRDFDLITADTVLDDCTEELRKWEWRYLRACWRRRVLTLKGHAMPAGSLAFSPDGRRLASAGGQTVRVWDTRDGQQVLFLHFNQIVQSVVFSPDGRRLAWGSYASDAQGKPLAGEVKVWDAHADKELFTLRGHTSAVWSVAFSPDGQKLASASWGHDGQGNSVPGEVKVWDAHAGKELLTLQGHTSAVWSVAFSPDGQKLASGSEDQTVKVSDARDGKELFTLRGHTSTVWSVAFSPDGQKLASASVDWVKVWDVRRNEELLSLREYAGGVRNVVFSPDGQRLATSSGARGIVVWDTQTGQQLFTLQGKTGMVMNVAFSPDGWRLASADGDAAIRVWDTRNDREALTLKGHVGVVHSVAFSPDGRWLASAGDCTVRVWDTRKSEQLLTLQFNHLVKTVAFSPDGQRLASGGAVLDGSGKPPYGEVKLSDAHARKELFTLRGHTGGVTSVAFSPDGRRLASASEDQTVKVWDAETGKELFTLRGHTGGVTSVAFSPDGRCLASASWGQDARGIPAPGEVKVWDAQAGQELRTLRGHGGGVTSVAFSPDGQKLASVSGDWVKVWDALGSQVLLTLQAAGRSVAFSPDGQRLASNDPSGTVKLWDASSGQELLTLRRRDGMMSMANLTFSPDNQRLASAADKMVMVWDATELKRKPE